MWIIKLGPIYKSHLLQFTDVIKGMSDDR